MGLLDGGIYRITNASLNLPLKPGSPAVNSYLIAVTDDKSDNFKWKVTSTGPNTYTVQNVGNSMFAWAGTNIYPPGNIVVNPASQVFTFNQISGDTYTITTADSKVYWTLNGNSPGQNVIVDKNGSSALSQWIVTDATHDLPTGTYTLTSAASGLPLKPQTRAQNANIISVQNDQSDDFKWELTNVQGKIYKIKNKATSMFAFGGTNIQPPGLIVINPSDQQYIIEPILTIPYTFTIATMDSGAFWATENASSGAKIVTTSNGTSQLAQFVIKP
jgi:hypothetical protein